MARPEYIFVANSFHIRANDKAYENVRFRFNDNILMMTDKSGAPIKRPDGKAEERGFTLNLSSTPKSIDLTISNRFIHILVIGRFDTQTKFATVFSLIRPLRSRCWCGPRSLRSMSSASSIPWRTRNSTRAWLQQ